MSGVDELGYDEEGLVIGEYPQFYICGDVYVWDDLISVSWLESSGAWITLTYEELGSQDNGDLDYDACSYVLKVWDKTKRTIDIRVVPKNEAMLQLICTL